MRRYLAVLTKRFVAPPPTIDIGHRQHERYPQYSGKIWICAVRGPDRPPAASQAVMAPVATVSAHQVS